MFGCLESVGLQLLADCLFHDHILPSKMRDENENGLFVTETTAKTFIKVKIDDKKLKLQ